MTQATYPEAGLFPGEALAVQVVLDAGRRFGYQKMIRHLELARAEALARFRMARETAEYSAALEKDAHA